MNKTLSLVTHILVRLDSRASADSPFLGTGSDKVKGQSVIFLTAGLLAVCCTRAGMVLFTANVGMSSAVKKFN